MHAPESSYPQRILDNAVIIAEAYEGPTGPVRIAPFIAAMDPTVAFGIARLLEAVANADLADIYSAAASLAVDYLREFIADDQDRVEIRSFVDPASKSTVWLPEPVRVPVEEIPRIEAAILAGDQPHVEFLWWSTRQSRGES